ncbi:cupin domain-containing protein [Pedobacter jamesrossensis]|uniref:Cupin domain-containing protein n=1 Tax=Pedobacter jamesrossensis TaxID=1908238 RepID=A0ABV8NMG2_9SPHI
MNLLNFLSSGLLELYISGKLSKADRLLVEEMTIRYEEVANERMRLELLFGNETKVQSQRPSESFDNRMMSFFSDLEKEKVMKGDDIPLISPFSNAEDWLRLVEGFIPEEAPETQFIYPLHQSEKRTQLLVVSAIDIDEEIHDELSESFLILKGSCVCSIEDAIFEMKAGDFMQIPLHKTHQVKLTSPLVIAILQHVSVS